MGWINDQFYYSKKLLRVIAENYTSIYNGLPRLHSEVVNLWELAELKADFDMALNSIGRGKWDGKMGCFKDYKYFGRLQQIVIADVFGVNDDYLGGLGFWDISKMRSYAYYLMYCYLNGGKDENTNQ